MTSLSSSYNINSDDWRRLAESKFVQPLQPRHRCVLCEKLLKEPLQLSCGDLFCRLCVEPHLTTDAELRCPGCDEPLEENCPAFPDNSAKKEILTKLKAYCQNQEYGCEETLILRDKALHEEICPFTPKQCSFKEYGCDFVAPKPELKNHHDNCDFRPASCQHCGTVVARFALQRHVEEECTESVAPCPFECGRTNLNREEMNEHMRLCDLRIVSCPFREDGCTFEGTMDKVKEHKAAAVILHLDSNHESLLASRAISNVNTEEIEKLRKINEDVLRQMELERKERKEAFDELKNQFSALLEKMNFVENEVYRMTSVTEAPSPQREENALQRSSPPTTEDTHNSESTNRPKNMELAKLEAEMKKLSKKLNEMELSQLSSNRSFSRLRGSDMSLSATSSKSEPTGVDRKLSLHDQWLKDLDLRLQISDTANYDGTLIWKITEYTRRKRNSSNGNALSLYSQPFYTSKYGYKMCCRVYLNGDGLGKNTHMSLFFSIMKGEYDNLLRWPFRQKVTLMLLDQGDSKGIPGVKHLVDSFRPDPKSNSFQRPTGEMNIASGCPLFVQQKTVEESSLYKKEDTIFIKCVVDTSDLH